MKRYIKSDNYDEYREIISMLKSAQTYEDMKKSIKSFKLLPMRMMHEKGLMIMIII